MTSFSSRPLPVAILCLAFSNICMAQGTVNDPTICNTQNLGNFYGVNACRNLGAPANTQWQSVEFVDRFYKLYYGIGLQGPNANQWWNAASINLTRYVNGGTTPPRIGDVIVSNGGKDGHIAIVHRVTGNSVCTAQQNLSNDASDVDGTRCAPLAVNGNTFTVGPLDSSGRLYPVIGWLRRPSSTNISNSYSFQAHPEGAMVTADGGTVYMLYSVSPDGPLSKVGFTTPAAFRNPYSQLYDDNQFGLDEVVTISFGELDQYPDAGFVVSSPGQLGNNERANPNGKLITDGQTIAIVSNGQKRQFTSSNVFLALGYKLCNVIRDDTYASYQTGPDIDLPAPAETISAPAPSLLTQGTHTRPTFSTSEAASNLAHTLTAFSGPVPGDFNGDGVPDLVWQNDSTRQVALWYMGGARGGQFQSFTLLADSGVPGWSLKTVADLNGDGHPDLIWQNDSTRQVAVWYMGGAKGDQFQSFAWLQSSNMPGWTLVGAADLDGNGKPDLLWQKDGTLEAAVWYMGGAQGDQFQSFAWLLLEGVAPWTLVGAADLNGDGHPDLIWLNPQNSFVLGWYMGGASGAVLQSSVWLYMPANTIGWKVVGLADQDGLGGPDLIWQNDTTRQVMVWYLAYGPPESWPELNGIPGWRALSIH